MTEEHQIAQAIKVSILRLAAMRELGDVGKLHENDWAFGEDRLVLLLGQLNNFESRAAFVELFDYRFGDAVFNAIGQISDEYKNELIPLFKERLGKPIATSPYFPSFTQKERDKQLQNWIEELSE